MRNAFILLHTNNYGIGFFKNIIAAFYSNKVNFENLNSEKLDQVFLDEVFDKDFDLEKFPFEKLYYLYPNQEAISVLTAIRLQKDKEEYKIDQLLQSTQTVQDWEKILFKIGGNQYQQELDAELDFINNKYFDRKELFLNQYARHIHYYEINDQIKWFKQYSNAKPFANKVDFIDLKKTYRISDLRDYKALADCIKTFLAEKIIAENFDNIIINLSLSSIENQVIWYVLSENNFLPKNVRFINCYDDKSNTHEKPRFRDIEIREAPLKLVSLIAENLYFTEPNNKSKTREIAEKQFKRYINDGFSILFLGERGTGKTRLAKKNSRIDKDKFIVANAASFGDGINAELELFGYEKGMFTDGLQKGKEGLFQNANGGALFIDEIHALLKPIQQKLMTALQTDENGFYTFRKYGANIDIPVKFNFMCASNKEIHELRKLLLPDFFDRIAQNIIVMPSLNDTAEDRIKHWGIVWNEKSFNNKIPDSKEFTKWLKEIELPGNFRDLERIAIWANNFLEFKKDEKLAKEMQLSDLKTYVKTLYDEYIVSKENTTVHDFTTELSLKSMKKEYLYEMANWAKQTHGGFKKTSEYEKKVHNSSVSEKTLYNWYNRIDERK